MNGGKHFQRREEDFLCGHCNTPVTGDGYTNHCPQCLWSKHVDVYPGDRLEKCGGMMEPILLEYAGKEQKLTHQCVLCGYKKRNRVQEDDNLSMLIHLAKKIADTL